MKKMARVTNEQSNGFTKDLGETTSVCKLMNNYEMLDKATTSSSTLKVSRYLCLMIFGSIMFFQIK